FQPGVSYTLTKSYNSGTRVLTVTANATANRNIDTVCNINFVITENGVIYNQTGNASCPGSGAWTHDWIVRIMVNGATGEALSGSHWAMGTTLTRTWNYTLPSGWVDA